MKFDVSRLLLELASIERAAVALKLDRSAWDPARRQLAVASQLADAGDLRGAAQALAGVEVIVNRLDEEIDGALAVAECRAKTIVAVRRALAAMGFNSGAPEINGDTTTVLAHASNGRKAEVKVSTAAGQVELASTFTDPADAVSRDHPQAAAVCEQAVLDQAEFHRSLQEAPGLLAGRIRAPERPTRGAAAGATGVSRAQRSAASEQPTYRERKAQ